MRRFDAGVMSRACVVALSALACVLAFTAIAFPIAPAWADEDVCGYAYLDPGENGELDTLVIQKEQRSDSDGFYRELGPVGSALDDPYARPWASSDDLLRSIHTLKFDGSAGPVSPTTLHSWFSNCANLESADLSGLDTSHVTDMASMFSRCSSLKSLDLSGFGMSNVTDMGDMLAGCSSLKSFNLSGLSTAHPTNIRGMFKSCSSLESLDLKGFDTSHVADMSYLFFDCTALTSLSLEGCDTSSVVLMQSMFNNCSSLVSLDLSRLNTSNVINMESMFNNCSSLTSLNLSGFDTSNVIDMAYLFYDCERLTTLDLSSFNASKATNMAYMFSLCSSLKSLDLSSLNAQSAETIASMFSRCRSLETLNLSGLKTSRVGDMRFLFMGCSSLESIDLSGFDTSSVSNMSYMFMGCASLKDIGGFSLLDTSNVTDMTFMFCKCLSLKTLYLDKFNTSSVTDMNGMFMGCSSLTTIDLRAFDTAKVEDISGMFQGCSSLSWLDLSGFSTASLKVAAGITGGCSSLRWVNLVDSLSGDGAEVLAGGFRGNDLPQVQMGPGPVSEAALERLFQIARTWSARGVVLSSAREMNDYLAARDEAAWFVAGEHLGVYAYEDRANGTLTLSPRERELASGESALGFVQGLGVPWRDDDIRRVVIESGACAPFSTASWFAEEGLTEIVGLENLDTSNVTYMSSMFLNCSSLKSLDLSGFDFSMVEDLGGMFDGCTSLESLDLGRFNAQNAKRMTSMFWGCEKLRALDLGDFTAPNVEQIGSMFFGCSSLASLDLSRLRVRTAQSMSGMFWGCSSLRALDLSGFDVTDISMHDGLFRNCGGLESVKLFTVERPGEYFEDAFEGCSNLSSVQVPAGALYVPDLPKGMWKDGAGRVFRHDDVPGGVAVTYAKVSDEPCYYATLSAGGGLVISSTAIAVEEGAERYLVPERGFGSVDEVPWRGRASDVTSVSFSGWVAPASMAHWFEGCSSLTSFALGSLDPHTVTFGLDPSGVKDFTRAFYGCSSLESLSFAYFSTNAPFAAEDLTEMFYGCSSLRELDLGGLDTRNAKSMKRMFHECRSLERVTLGDKFSFRGAAWSRLAGSELPPGVWVPVDAEGSPTETADAADAGDAPKYKAYASDSLPSFRAATYRKASEDELGELVVESLRGDAGDAGRKYTIETELVDDGAGGYVAESTYVLGEEYDSDTLAVGDSADAASTTTPIGAAHVTAQTVLRKVKGGGKGKTTCVVLGPKVGRVAPGAFAGSPINRVQVKSGALAKKANVLNCLKGSGVKRVEVLRDAGTKLKRESVAKAFKTWADPSRAAKLDGYVVNY